ncbi:MAG: TIGR03619 family F420-dependent LLM class oxidoreductase [Pseudomonadales bacterium]
MKFWQSLAFVELEQTAELAKFCEGLGFYGVSYGDHLVTTKAQVDQYLYTDDGNVFWNPETHWSDPWALTAALAQVTTTLHFMTTIYILPLRDPFSAAKAISTAAYLSNERVVLGVGVGWQQAEFDMVGQSYRNRGRRTDEALQIIRDLMSGEMTEFHGQHYDFEPAKMSSGLRKPLPILVGGYSEPAMRRAARQDGWMALSHPEGEIYPLIERPREFRRQEDCGNQAFEIWTGVKNPERDTYKRLADAGVTMVNGTNFFVDGKPQASSIDFKKKAIEEFAKKFLT